MSRQIPTTAPDSGARILLARQDEHYFGRRVWSPHEVAAQAGENGITSATPGELQQAHAFSETLMSTQLAPLWALASAHLHTEGTAWVYREAGAVTGVFLILPLTWDGEAALRAGRFSYVVPRLDLLCRPGDEISAVYQWFAGGSTPNARRALMRTAAAWYAGFMKSLRAYGRAASEEGERGMEKFGFMRLAADRADLFIRPGAQGLAA